MADQDLLLQALRSFAGTMGGTYDMTEMSYQLCDRVTEVLGATGAGMSVADSKGQLRFVTATDASLVEIEEAQEREQEGPCVIAFMNLRPVVMNDIQASSDWPTYRAAARKANLAAVVGYPLTYNGKTLGALNLYDAHIRDWSEDDLDVIGVFADMATAYLVRTSELAETRQLAESLQTALDTRVVIEQAKGILAGEFGISVDEAFTILRQHSRNNNLKLADLCHGVVDLGLRVPRPKKGK